MDAPGGEGVPPKTALAVIGAIVGVVALIAIVTSGGGDESPSAFDGSDPTFDDLAGEDEEATATSTTLRPDGSIPTLDCSLLLSGDEAAGSVWPVGGGPFGTLLFAESERCVHQVADEPDYFVIVEPAAPTDFDPDATLLGVPGTDVDGPGEVSRWFAGADEGTLIVAQPAETGAVVFRLSVGRPDLTDAERLAIAGDLASLVVRRFPGVVPTTTTTLAPQPVEFELEPLASGPSSWLENIETRVDRGEWSRAEGYEATLRWLLGEPDPRVPDDPADRAADGLVTTIRRFVDTEATADEAESLRTLLDRLLPPAIRDAADLVLAPPIPEEPSDDGEDTVDAEPGDEADSECPNGFWLDDICGQVYGPTVDSVDDDYVVIGPAEDELPVMGIDAPFIDEIRQGMTSAALVLDPLAAMPPVAVFITPFDNQLEVFADPRPGDEQCLVQTFDSARSLPDAELRQWVAFEVSRCLGLTELTDRIETPGESNRWVFPAVFYTLSTIAEPDGRLETRKLDDLHDSELVLPLEQRSSENLFFLLWLHDRVGTQTMLDVVRDTATAGGFADQAEALAATPSMDQWLQGYAEAITDRGLRNGLGITYDNVDPALVMRVAQARLFAVRDVEQLGTARVEIGMQEPGTKACVAIETEGDATLTWRPVDERSWNDGDPPDEIVDPIVLVWTSTDAAGAAGSIFVDRTVDSDEECEPEDDDDPAPAVDVPGFDLDCGLCGASDFFVDALGVLG